MVSVFDIFKIGIGPSSSHTVGPMKAGKQFADDLIAAGLLEKTTRIQVDVYGSLSLTGKGHATDIAIIMGLAGNLPDSVDIDAIPGFIRDVEERERLLLANQRHEVDFPRDNGMNFHKENLPLHENGMSISAFSGDELLYKKTYYSIGGGFSWMKSILVRLRTAKPKCLIRISMPLICKNTVTKPGCLCLRW